VRKPLPGAEWRLATALFLPAILALEKNCLSRLYKCVVYARGHQYYIAQGCSIEELPFDTKKLQEI
jgi:hypothetical protein